MAETTDKDKQPKNSSEQDPLIGTSLGGYQITGILGRGGYAIVYRATQTQLGREVALKVLIEDEEGVTPEQVEAFMREARLAAALNHPCLVQVHDVVEAGGRHFLSMELVPGGNLARHLKAQGAMPWRDAVVIIRDVAEALQCAHEHGMVHRDVKPANILLTRTGGAKLADLGLAGGEQHQHAGTAAFMSPEQVLRRKVGKRSDLYSLGCSAFAMLTGRAPFNHPSSKQMLAAHVREEAPSLKSLGVQVPPELDRLVRSLLAKEVAERPAGAAAVVEVLERIESGVPSQPSRSQRVRSRRHRSRGGGQNNAVMLIILLILAVGAVFLVWHFLG